MTANAMVPDAELNSVSDHPLFRRTALFRAFGRRPLEFIDVGAAGEVHPPVRPGASLTAYTGFKPDEASAGDLEERYCRARSGG